MPATSPRRTVILRAKRVVRGDVSSSSDVTAAVAACFNTGRRIGGVIQAAMGLHEALFSRMPYEAWHTGIDPKWQCTWNLHNALQVHVDKDPRNEPDFFLLTSSVSGTVGTATEANFCAANGFLDVFARWRRSHGCCCERASSRSTRRSSCRSLIWPWPANPPVT